jgi:hypothetical protein
MSALRGASRNHAITHSSWTEVTLAAIAGVTAIALLFFLVPAPAPGPGPDGTWSPAPGTSADASVSPPGSPSATAAGPSGRPQSSAAPTGTPTAPWATITWSEPSTPPTTINLHGLVPWEGGYVAVGQVAPGDAAFLTSRDGLHWEVRHRVADVAGQVPRHLVALPGELFAFSDSAETVPTIWRSVDGIGWAALDSPSWAAAWRDHLFLDVTGGPNGLVAIGDAIAGEHGELLSDPVVLHSPDAVTWRRAALDGASELSVVRDVIGLADGYAVLGGEEVGPVTGMGTPQAWRSDDGLTWSRATVEGAAAADNQFESRSAVAGIGGILARTQLLCAGCPPTGVSWISDDGRLWERAASSDEPPVGMLAGDGERMVVLSTAEGWMPIGESPKPYPGLTRAWVSTDGLSWQPMALSHPMTDQPEAWWVVPDGIVFAGVASFWFGAAASP